MPKKKTYFLDDQEFKTSERVITPNEIFKLMYPHHNVYDYFLYVCPPKNAPNGTKAISLDGKMAQPVIIDEGMSFKSALKKAAKI